ncbi:M20/M25/M40 family metallo-hydrolase, partial [Blautia schinkii]|uniref:M20/M25/M40 family metallo-hydrolase n=1 Tax=Blautia schinkii TaxID=180164 RepID=UPI0023AE87A7
EQLKGNVKIIFQAAEESCHGAQYYVEHGFLDDVNAIYGVHIRGDLDAPYMNFESGPRMASCDNFRIEVEGKSAHGSTPHQGVDAILAAAHIITEIQTVVSRMNDQWVERVIHTG